MPAIDISERTIARAQAILDSPAQRSALTVDAAGVIEEVARGANSVGDRCSECGRHVGHYPECSRHWSAKSRPTGTTCPGCKHGDYGPGARHNCTLWGGE